MRYGFLDESGTVAPFSGSNFLIVAVLTTIQPRRLALLVKKLYKKLRRRSKAGEMKASTSEVGITRRLLQMIAKEDVAIVAVVFDKRSISKPPQDPEDIYRQVSTKAIEHCVRRWPRITLYLDKRYTNNALRDRLEEAIREGLIGTPQEVVLVRQEDSLNRKELQAVDYVAWTLFQKYEKGDDQFYNLIVNKIVVEEVVERNRW